jgi:nitrogen-specific signal transduction histidine kinase/ActR/RegA family two-component response regulator
MILLSVEDISERKQSEDALRRSEEHLRQSQKMEAMGRLAGGVAHDFNNLLTAVIGYSSLLLETVAGDDEALDQVQEIKSAGERAAALTSQLLAFSRRQVLQPKIIDLNPIVADFERLLRRTVGEHIKVTIRCAPDLWQVRADPGEIGRAIMNLSLNARDAMPDEGTLTIETSNLNLSEAEAREQDLPAGRQVMLEVRDTGVGMDAQIQDRIFEPFFTTKEAGKGTGLGLATVLGIVKQSGGVIGCRSEIGEGTSFRILLPAVADAVPPDASTPTRLDSAPGGTETILLVEDDDAVRILAERVLKSRGYTIIEARNGREGLKLCERHPGQIDLLLTDMMMPELGGRELAASAVQLRPGLKVLLVSAHSLEGMVRDDLHKATAFLAKPFTPLQLAQKVREALDSDKNTPRSTDL